MRMQGTDARVIQSCRNAVRFYHLPVTGLHQQAHAAMEDARVAQLRSCGAEPALQAMAGSFHGTAGAAGQTSLVRVVAEPVGANCTSGGVKVQSGLDGNGDLVLDAAEVTAFQYVCPGPTGPAGAMPLAAAALLMLASLWWLRRRMLKAVAR